MYCTELFQTYIHDTCVCKCLFALGGVSGCVVGVKGWHNETRVSDFVLMYMKE